ncbi:hypothetical protein OH76DRAFT_1366463, partial [Lentinus brumalis]
MEELGQEVEDSGDESVEELEGEELLMSLEQVSRSVYCELMKMRGKEAWEQGEKELRGVHTGRAARTERDHRQKARQDETEKAAIRDSDEARRFRAFFKPEDAISSPSLPQPRAPSAQAHLAAVTACQESDTAFIRSQ